MGAYFQMGHHTENLVGATDLTDFYGILLSPVNREPSDLKKDIPNFRKHGSFDILLDPQLYFPRVNRGVLKSHPYFPKDFDTADLTNRSWWQSLGKDLVHYAQRLELNGVTSPAQIPSVFNDAYYDHLLSVGDSMVQQIRSETLRVLQTLMVSLNQLTESGFPERLASIASKAEASGFYLIIHSEVEPRKEISDSAALAGVMKLVHFLEGTGKRVLVACCSSDVLLLKAAGASHCATGKFFNLRRFTKSRFEDEPGGGTPIAYWFEHSLMAFLREADVLLLEREGFGAYLAKGASDNHWSKEILGKLHGYKAPDEKRPAWISDSWRQFLAAFVRMEKDYHADVGKAKAAVKAAEEAWSKLDEKEVIFEERHNKGQWITPWRQALATFSKSVE